MLTDKNQDITFAFYKIKFIFTSIHNINYYANETNIWGNR